MILRAAALALVACASPALADRLTLQGELTQGGLIRGAEYFLLHVADSKPSLAKIHERMLRVLQLAKERRASTARIADELAEARLKRAKTFRDLHWGGAASKSSKIGN